MKKLIATLIAGLLVAGSASAGEPVNKKCPVSGKDVDATKTTDVSVTVGFCCPKCLGKFEADKKMQEDAVRKYAGSKDAIVNTKCPITNKDVDKDNTSKATMTVGFCCEKCPAVFEKDPKKYMPKVK